MEGIKDILKNKVVPKKSNGGAYYSWQDKAVRYAKDLGVGDVKKNKKWFRLFRITPPGILDKAYTFCKDLTMKNPESYFYWAVNKFRKNGRIV